LSNIASQERNHHVNAVEETGMPVHQIAQYRVNANAVNKVKRAIEEFVDYVRASEPGTRVYSAWQQQDDPTRFVHFFIFADAAAQTIHSKSDAVQRFKSVYSPELAGGDVVFTNYELVATNGQ
jgi:quinol monooxygenase YgiN